MAEIKEVKPGYEDEQLAASYYFYSEYDPSEHFEYNIPFLKDGTTIDAVQFEKNRRNAFAKAVEYHFSFEQVLPREADDYIKLYRMRSDVINNTNNLVFTEGVSAFQNVTEKYFINNIVPSLALLPIKTVQISGDNGLAIDPDATHADTPYSRYMGQYDYSKMSLSDLKELYNHWTTDQGTLYQNATQWNKYCYDNALFCRIKRPNKSNNSSVFVSPYDFRKTLRLVNSVFNFKLPVEEGWYIYSKQNKKWEYIDFKKEAVNNNG